jgi:type II secretory pathway component PulJ
MSTQAPSSASSEIRGFVDAQAFSAPSSVNAQPDNQKVLPLPRWLTRVYYIFPIILYIPDGIFNFYVYTDGVNSPGSNPFVAAGFFALWFFVSLGVVGMAYLLSVLAPWHWGQRHYIQAFFCGVGILVATGITTWNSLAYRSASFKSFRTDEIAYSIWPQLRTSGISITMVFAAVAPPFWGLFWAVVQPTRTGRTLEQIQESHAERLMRTQQEAELKTARAEANARIRAAQLKGMAATATAARESSRAAFGRKDEVPALATPVLDDATNGEPGQVRVLEAASASMPLAQSGGNSGSLQFPQTSVAQLDAPLQPEVVDAIKEARSTLLAQNGGTGKVSATALAPLVAAKLGIEEDVALSLIGRYVRQQRQSV